MRRNCLRDVKALSGPIRYSGAPTEAPGVTAEAFLLLTWHFLFAIFLIKGCEKFSRSCDFFSPILEIADVISESGDVISESGDIIVTSSSETADVIVTSADVIVTAWEPKIGQKLKRLFWGNSTR